MDKFKKSVSLLCWAYNEEDLILDYLKKATELMDKSVEDYEIILIDDCSTDNTNKIAKEFQETNSNLKIYKNKKNMNVGYSSQKAIQLASKKYLFWQTIDWCYDISNLREYLNYLNNYDIVQGVRRKAVNIKIRFLKPITLILKLFRINYLTKRSDTIWKAFVSIINYLLIRLLFRVPLSDYQNVTIYPTKWIQSIKFESNSSFSNPEGLIKSYWQGKKIIEVPINFIQRQLGKGEAKGTKIKSIMASVTDILKLWFKWIVLRKRGKIKKGLIDRYY